MLLIPLSSKTAQIKTTAKCQNECAKIRLPKSEIAAAISTSAVLFTRIAARQKEMIYKKKTAMGTNHMLEPGTITAL
jgi:hypothetical protein